LLISSAILSMLAVTAAAGSGVAPINNPAILNIGYLCRWQERCMSRQEKAMNRAVAYVKKRHPPSWKVQLCNRNAARKRSRVDWVGFNNCIRNPAVRRAARRGQ
jgi:hypothetical protein